jgi:hypothetical protein
MTWFWIVTLTWPSPGGQKTNTASGTLTPDHVATLRTRSEAVPAVIGAARRGMGIPADVASATLFISIEPDALDATVPEAESR